MLEAVLKRVLEEVLSRVTEFSAATGDATDGSTTTLEDTSAVWEVDKWKDAVVEITHAADGKHYFVTITSNTANTLTFPAIAVTVAASDHYEIRMTLRLADIDKWGGTALTGRDISLDLAKLDVALSTIAAEATLAKLIPIAKAAIFNTALPGAEANWLGSDITPTNSPSYLRIYACVSVTGILRVARTVGAVTVTEDLNSGTALVAGAAYLFTVPWRSGDGINIRYSVTTGTINRLLIDEIGGAE